MIPIRTPPLRERREDIPLLAEHFLRRFAAQMGKKRRQDLRPRPWGCSMRYAWPGNVRELENVIERAVALETTEAILPERLPESLRGGTSAALPGAEIGPGFNLDEHLRVLESQLLMQALGKADGDRAEAARILGVTPRSLRYLIQKHAMTGGQKLTPADDICRRYPRLLSVSSLIESTP